MNVLLWCPFIYVIDTPFQNPSYSHVQQTNWLIFDIFILLSIFPVVASKIAKPQQKKFLVTTPNQVALYLKIHCSESAFFISGYNYSKHDLY